MILETCLAPRFRLISVDRNVIIGSSARMRHMIDAAAQRAPVPAIQYVECQRRMRGHDDELEEMTGPFGDHLAVPDWALAWADATKIAPTTLPR